MKKRIALNYNIILFVIFLSGCKTPAPVQEEDFLFEDNSLLTENEQMKKRIGELQALIHNLEQTIDKSNEEIGRLTSKIESLEKNEKDLSDSLNATKGDLEKKIVALIGERDALKEELAASNAERNRLQEKYEQGSRKIKRNF